MDATHDGPRLQTIYSLHFSVQKEDQNKKKSDWSFCVSIKICVLQVYFTSKSWRQIWWCVNQYFKYTFYQCFYT